MSIETTASLSERIHIPEYTIRCWARSGVIPARKIGRKFLFIYEEIVETIIQMDLVKGVAR
jgi:predicted site-specific integrase-resolvase